MNLHARARRAAEGIHGAVDLMAASSAATLFGTYERFVRFDARRRRNQKIAAIAMAMLLTLALIGGAVELFRGAGHRTPASITPKSVGDLQVVGTGDTEGAATVFAGPNAIVVSTALGHLYAFSPGCATTPCKPFWTATLEGPATRVVVAEGLVFVAETGRKGDGQLYAFPEDCDAGGAVCDPLWTADLDSPVANQRLSPVAHGRSVYVGTLSGTVYAFPIGCQGSCEPTWVRSVGQRVNALAAAGGTIYVGTGIDEEPPRGGPLARSRGTIAAFPADCGDCETRWTVRGIPSVFDVEVANGVVYVGTLGGAGVPGPGVLGYPTACEVTCSPIWTARTECCADAEVIGDTVFVNQHSSGLVAFPTDCGGGVCLPLWRSRVNAISFRGLAFGDDVLFVGSGDVGGIYAYPTSCSDPCESLWTGLEGLDVNDAVVVGDRLVVAGTSGLAVLGLRGGDAPAPVGGAPPTVPILLILVIAAIVVIRIARRRSSSARIDRTWFA